MKVSIITINYNNRNGLYRTIESVINQVYQDFEYIVIDGASTDGSIDVIKEYAEYLSYWVSEPDKGIYHAMNKGVEVASGDYCLFLNSGDYLYDKYTLLKVMNKDCSEEIVIGKLLFLAANKLSNVNEPITMLKFYEDSIPHPSTFIKRTLFDQFKFDENYKIVSDWKFFLEVLILNECTYKIIDVIVTCYNSEGISSQNTNLVYMERQKVLEEILPVGVRLDYLRFVNGSNYTEDTYDKFYIKLRDYRISKIIYSVSVFILRGLSLFKKSASFSWNFPLLLNNKTDQ
mgnify:CR=1 FL=1